MGYQAPTTPLERCSDATDNGAFHIAGGPFLGWGGGLGVTLARFRLTDYDDRLTRRDFGYLYRNLPEDVSEWEGVSFWARRGPDSQPLLRVLVGTADTDDDVAFFAYAENSVYGTDNPIACKRTRECGCTNHKECRFVTAEEIDAVENPIQDVPLLDGMYCGNPASEPAMATQGGANSSCPNCCGSQFDLLQVGALIEDKNKCDDIYAASQTLDPLFYGKPCTPYTFRNGVTASFCYDPETDEPPGEPDEGCGDHFTFPVRLSTDWQFFRVPFSVMSQQGWAKKVDFFDLTKVTMIRFTWNTGYIDYWIDNVSFYRKLR